MNQDDLAKLVNRSGFLFQLSVEHHVRTTSSQHGWEVLAREYPWHSLDRTRGGFIDFVAGHNVTRAVVECKRTQGGEWIFLVEEPATETAILRALWSYLTRSGTRGIGWGDFAFDPASLRSEFCVVRGGSDDDKPMLERIAADLVRASESLAREELETSGRRRGAALYIPLIITSAKLYVCRVAPDQVDLSLGSVPASARFEEVHAIRFRKSLPSDILHEPESYESLEEGLVKKERSAVVVNVEHLAEWLANVRERLRSPLAMNGYPWADLEP